MSVHAGQVARWTAAPLAALFGAALAQVLVFRSAGHAYYASTGAWPGGVETWAIKTLTSFFMGAAFVGLACWVAPAGRQRVALAAFGIVVLWAGKLALSAFEHGFFVWLLAMGVSGLVGAACALLLAWRTRAAQQAMQRTRSAMANGRRRPHD